MKHTVRVDDGCTAVLLSGWKIRPQPEKAGEQAEDAYLLLLATPPIIIDDEEESVSTGVCP